MWPGLKQNSERLELMMRSQFLRILKVIKNLEAAVVHADYRVLILKEKNL